MRPLQTRGVVWMLVATKISAEQARQLITEHGNSREVLDREAEKLKKASEAAACPIGRGLPSGHPAAVRVSFVHWASGSGDGSLCPRSIGNLLQLCGNVRSIDPLGSFRKPV